jgi:branched-chain amino acid transport system permease protein
VFNFAQGAIVLGGCFLAYQLLAVNKIPLLAALVCTAVTGGILGMLCELLAVRPLRWARGIVGANAIVTTVGASTALIGAYGVKWGYQPLLVPFQGPAATLHFFGTLATPVEVIVVAAAIIVALALHFWFRASRRGQAYLAVAEDRDAAALRGVNVNALSIGAFTLAGAFGAASGLIIGPITYAFPSLGTTLALGGFVALALGGEGSFIGGLIGGFLVGLAATFATRYLGASYSDIAVLALLIVTFIVRPRGLGGVAESRSV